MGSDLHCSFTMSYLPVLRRDETKRISNLPAAKMPKVSVNAENEEGDLLKLGSLKGVFERRTTTGNEAFSLLTRLGATTIVLPSVVTRIGTIYLKIRAHPLPRNVKSLLPVAVRHSKTPLLKHEASL